MAEQQQHVERRREAVTGSLTLDYLLKQASAGWRLVALEWERTVDGETPTLENTSPQSEIPYGFQVAADGQHLEASTYEQNVLMTILEGVVEDRRTTEIAEKLNNSGWRTRQGHAWSPTAVFNMLPRLIENGPALLTSPDWRQRRPQVVALPPQVMQRLESGQ